SQPPRGELDRGIGHVYWVLPGLCLIAMAAAAVFIYRANRRLRAEVAERDRIAARLREVEGDCESLLENTTEGIFRTTAEGRFITANKPLARLYGFECSEQFLHKVPDVASQLCVNPSQRDSLMAALKAENVATTFEFQTVGVDGRTMWLRENVRAVRDERGQVRHLEGTVVDISDRWWADQRRRLQDATSRVLNDAATVTHARPKLIASICEILNWKMGAVWDVEETGNGLRCSEVWHRPEIDITEFEQAASKITFRPGEGFAGKVWLEGEPKWIPDLGQDAALPGTELALAKGMSSAFGVPVTVNGAILHVFEFFSGPVRMPDLELMQTLGLIANQLGQIIKRKNAEDALRKSEMRKAAILQSALDCVISFDLKGRIIEFNPAAERAFGYTQREAVGREMVELIFPTIQRDPRAEGTEFLNAISPDNPNPGHRMELVATGRDGTEFPAEIAISRINLDSGPMFTAYLRDITERQEAERLTSELAAVVTNSNDAIITCTLNGTIQNWNVGAERIYGYTAKEAVGHPLHLLFPEECLDEFPQMLTAVQSGASLANYETARLRKDGRKISVSLTDSPIYEGGKITGLSSIARDMTERRRLEGELLQSQKMEAVGRLAGGIAHDFNNILTAIIGYSDLVLGQLKTGDWMYKHLIEVRKAAELAASLTHQLLAFSRRQPLFPQVFSLNDTVRNIHKMLQRVIGEPILVKTQLKAVLAQVKADPSQIEQVLLNLCVNARDAMPEGGKLRITTEDVSYSASDETPVNEMPAGEYVKLAVIDTGVGIAPEIVKHIFEPFFTTKEKGHGTWLGLATCYGIVQQSGGYISVASEAGKGAVFTIYLPRVDQSGKKASIRKPTGELPGGNETILYVEDEITVRSLTAHVLRRLGYTVLEASDVKSARDTVEAQEGRDIDLLFSDVVLPDAGGRELSDWVQERSKETKVLFTSGYVDETILRRYGVELGTTFLQKPFAPIELAKKVREIMDQSYS
ncbi:MAG: PAS domain S-box protein, partial [Verrucomicrobiota bacterium]|nr:PAS domain S-box protein [Verrucomicrobiota bacterium]